MYHNTTNADPDQVSLFEEKAVKQEDKVLSLFRQKPELTASECQKLFDDPATPLTSIRRAMSDLCRKEKIEKTEETREGIFGRQEHVYALKPVN